MVAAERAEADTPISNNFTGEHALLANTMGVRGGAMKYCKFRQYLPDDDKFHYWGFIGGGFVSPLLRVFRENEKGTYEWNDVPAKKVLGNSDHSIGMADKNGNDDGFVNFYGGKVKTKFRKEEEQC